MTSNTRTRNTNWNGIFQDLFGDASMYNMKCYSAGATPVNLSIKDPDQNGESLQDSSSGVVSTTTSTFKGSYSSSESLLDSRHSGWSSPTATPTVYSKSCVRQNKNQTLMHNLTNHHNNVNNNTSSLGSFPNVDIINAKLNRIHLEKPPKLMLGMKKSKSQSRSSPFQYLSDDIIVKIFSNLTTNQLCKCSRVCKLWYRLSWDPTLWTSIVLNSITLEVDKALRCLTKQLSYNTPSVCVIIERINVNNCEKLTDKGLHTISKRCPELRKLEVHNCSNITNSALFDLISNCVNLEYLNVSGCLNITSISLANSILVRPSAHYLQQVYLLYLDMSDCCHLDDNGLEILALHCSRLQFLYLRRCSQITDKGLQHLTASCTGLKDLSISDCPNITDFGIMELSRMEPDLRYLSIAKCDKISDVGIKYIAQHSLKLRYLNCRGCEAISDDSLERVVKRCHRLRSLDVGKCDITDRGLFILAKHAPHLKRLSVKSCFAITDRGIILLAEHCRHLQQLNIQDCHLSVDAYRTVKKNCRFCIIEHTNPGFY
ncbi:F-box/LRR-repeat protein 7 isoform X1 [Octopus sinensis]|uniref:F-box/LRR-repeat protein 7 isoform X1 n=2 Tax=Octopus sinensis TaxID=2607531 RepID=A0A6P7T8J0_9MOLL|nr:F-box/LRR-repeat protein 7 isoform X1 [Octopus sinensis]